MNHTYNIIFINEKNNIIYRLLLTQTKNFVFTQKNDIRSCKCNIINKKNIINRDEELCVYKKVTL